MIAVKRIERLIFLSDDTNKKICKKKNVSKVSK